MIAKAAKQDLIHAENENRGVHVALWRLCSAGLWSARRTPRWRRWRSLDSAASHPVYAPQYGQYPRRPSVTPYHETPDSFKYEEAVKWQ